ncbi:unnamed protein product [Paramecium sonneborni]|uniref:RING-type domain-containing protein n=1 Tax=Paramecium sonneborni TaxID=65129 RepID=A0A8S1QDN2_9CILI|nr:unnamed protein product [Paramecium sonneborni]
MYQIIPISDTIKSQYPQLKDYYLCQYLGENKLSAITCSILHYLLNRRMSRSLEYFKSSKTLYKQQQSKEIAKIFKESLQEENPIQSFFEKLEVIDKNNLMIEIFLQDFCFSYQLTYQGQICLNYMVNFLDLNIIILPSLNRIGKGIGNVIIIQENDEYYFIIPEPQFKLETQLVCFHCSRQVFVFMKLYCNHIICWNCLLKEKSKNQMGNFDCRCGQVVLKIQIEQLQNEINSIARDNQFNLILEQFYHQQSSYLVQRKSVIRTSIFKQLNLSSAEQLTTTEIQYSLLDETNRAIEQLTDICFECKRESNKPYFIVINCQHKFCFDCISKEFLNQSCGGCYCLACFNKISKNEYETYKKQINLDIDQEKEKINKQFQAENECHNCYQKFTYQLFRITNCWHNLCGTCIEKVFAFNYFTDYYCQVSNCTGTYSKLQYQKFKQEQQKISFTSLENSCNQPSCEFDYLNYCKYCKNSLGILEADNEDQICLDCRLNNSKNKENNVIKNIFNDEQELELDWSLSVDKCQKCQNQSKYELFQIPLCNHKFCYQCLQNLIQIKQKEYNCLQKSCQFKFKWRAYKNYQINILQDQEIIKAHKNILNEQQKKKQQNTNQFEHQSSLMNLTQTSISSTKSSTSSTKSKQRCSYCNQLNETDLLFQIKCGHQICSKCCLRLNGFELRCNKCLVLFDTVEYQNFKQACKFNCDNCQNIYTFNQIMANKTCCHLLCYQCLLPIYKNKKQYFCCVKLCKKLLNENLIGHFLQKQNSQEFVSKDKIQFLDQQKSTDKKIFFGQDTNNIITKTITTESQKSYNSIKDQQTQSQNIYQSQQCMFCNSIFNDYNLPVPLYCNRHISGVCCILQNYKTCFKCDEKY